MTRHQWGLAFEQLLKARGVERGQGSRNDKAASTCATVAQVAKDLGVPERTAKHRLSQADTYRKLPAAARRKVDNGEVELLPHLKAEAKERQKAAGKSHGRGQKVVAKLPQAIDQGKARDKAAATVGVSPKYVSDVPKNFTSKGR